MSYSFLIIIAVPLGIYLLIVLFSTRDVGKSKRTRRVRNMTLTPGSTVELPEQPVTDSATDQSPTAPTVPAKSDKKKSRRRRKRAQPLEEAAPPFAFDYSGRLWVAKKQRGFFRRLKRPHLPPDG